MVAQGWNQNEEVEIYKWSMEMFPQTLPSRTPALLLRILAARLQSYTFQQNVRMSYIRETYQPGEKIQRCWQPRLFSPAKSPREFLSRRICAWMAAFIKRAVWGFLPSLSMQTFIKQPCLQLHPQLCQTPLPTWWTGRLRNEGQREAYFYLCSIFS